MICVYIKPKVEKKDIIGMNTNEGSTRWLDKSCYLMGKKQHLKVKDVNLLRRINK